MTHSTSVGVERSISEFTRCFNLWPKPQIGTKVRNKLNIINYRRALLLCNLKLSRDSTASGHYEVELLK